MGFSVHLGKLRTIACQLLVGRNTVTHLPFVELLICDHIEVSRTGKTEYDGFLLSRFLAPQCLINGNANGVGAFGCGRIPSTLAKYSAASKTSVCLTLVASMSP